MRMKRVVDEYKRVDAFVAWYHEMIRRVGASEFYPFDRSCFKELRFALGSAGRLMVIEPKAPEGGGVFFERTGIVQDHLGRARTDALHLGADKQLFDEALSCSKARSNFVLCFGGSTNPESSSLVHFKSGSSEWYRPLRRTMRVLTVRSAYAKLTAQYGCYADANDDTKFFRRYRSRSHASAK